VQLDGAFGGDFDFEWVADAEFGLIGNRLGDANGEAVVPFLDLGAHWFSFGDTEYLRM